jgi:hypothetical protein
LTPNPVNPNPFAFVHQIYDDVWNVGTLLQTDEGLTEILNIAYRPWPKVKEGTAIAEEFYKVHDRNKQVVPVLILQNYPVPNPFIFCLQKGGHCHASSVFDTRGRGQLRPCPKKSIKYFW